MAERQVGVFGGVNPAAQALVVSGADFNEVGALGLTERRIDKLLLITNPSDWALYNGSYVSGSNAAYVMDSFWRNTGSTVSAKLYWRSYVASDAVTATATLVDINGTPANTLRFDAAILGDLDKSTFGNRIGLQVTKGTRFATTLGTGVASATQTLVSVADVRVGDILDFVTTAAQRKVTAVDETAKTVTLASTITTTTAEVVNVKKFKVLVYVKNQTGASELKETWDNLTMESENARDYVQNVVNNISTGSRYIKITDLASASTVYNSWPAEITTTFYLGTTAAGSFSVSTAGTNGTSPSSANWNTLLADFNSYRIRIMFNTDATASTDNVNGEAYCKATHTKTPIWLVNTTADQTAAQFRVTASALQRSDDVFALFAGQYIRSTDPLKGGENPTIDIPNVGAKAAAMLRTWQKLGIHRVSAGPEAGIILGSLGVGVTTEANKILDTTTQSDLLRYGVNLVYDNTSGRVTGMQFHTGRTLSTATVYRYENVLAMRSFIRDSITDSLQGIHQTKNGTDLFKRVRSACRVFLSDMYRSSSNNGTEGAFATFENPDGTFSTFDQVVTIICDGSNNTTTTLALGQLNVDIEFAAPTPAESVRVGVGAKIALAQAA